MKNNYIFTPLLLSIFFLAALNAQELDFYNTQWLSDGTNGSNTSLSVDEGTEITVYSKAYEAGVTDAVGQGAGIECWIGFNSADTDPSTWDESAWQVANFGQDNGNDDEYNYSTSSSAVGTHYISTRWRLDNGAYTYGGASASNGGAWDGVNNNNIGLTVNAVAQPLLITTSVCSTATSVRLTGPWWGWDPSGGPEAADNGDGTWTFTLDPMPTANMEFLLVVDGVQENLISIMVNAGDCAPVTDYANYANRLWTVGSGNITNTYGQCGNTCVAPVITLTGTDVTINNGDSYTDAGATASDDEEGDITANIVVGGDTVDTDTDGTYTITYDVSDGAGNAATTVSRVVTVETPLVCTNLESFESFPPLDWTLTSSNTSNSITQSADYAVTGSNSLRFSSYNSASTYDQYAVTPKLVTTTGDQTISFWYKGYSFGTEKFKVGWSSTGDDVATDFTWSDEITTTTTGVQFTKTDLPVGTTYVAIHYYSPYQYYMYVDDFCTPALFVPDCVAPNTLVASNITSSSADISWTSDATNFNVEYGAEGFTQGSGTTDTSAIASYSLTGLSSNTSYDIYVQTNCGSSGVSEWVGPLTITTSCPTVTSFPYTHGFETLDCWTNSDASAAWALDAGDDYGPGSVTEGSSAVFFNDYDYSSGSTSDLMSPNLDLSALTIARLTFDYYDSGGSDIVEVLVDNGSGPVVVYTTAATVTPWTTITVDLPDFAGQTVQIGFRGTSVWGSSNPHIDNLIVAEAPSCLEPTALSVASITSSSADISWTSDDSSFNVEVVDVTAGGTATGTATYTGVTSPYSLSGLDSNTEYEVYVQTDCGSGDTSAWAGPVSFTTEPAPIVPDYTNDFSTFPGEFWSEGSGSLNAGPTGSTSSWEADGFGNSGLTGAARINLYSSKDEWLISPMFDLSSGTFYLNVDAAAAEFASSTLDAIFGTDDFATLMASTDGGSTWVELYRWDASNNPGVAGAGIPEITLSNYTATSKFAFYGKSTTSAEDVDFFVDDFQITTTSLGVEDNQISLFNYFPNPVKDVLTIKAQKAVEDITVFNMLGQVVKRQTPNTRDCTVDLSAMQSGAYFVQVSIDNTVETVRVLKN